MLLLLFQDFHGIFGYFYVLYLLVYGFIIRGLWFIFLESILKIFLESVIECRQVLWFFIFGKVIYLTVVGKVVY